MLQKLMGEPTKCRDNSSITKIILNFEPKFSALWELQTKCCSLDHKVILEYQVIVSKLEERFGTGLELDSILLIIGVQELGQGLKEFSKDEKMNLMHIAICTILEPFGYYEYTHDDEDGWPHYKKVDNLPPLVEKEQEFLLKKAVIEYFHINEYM